MLRHYAMLIDYIIFRHASPLILLRHADMPLIRCCHRIIACFCRLRCYAAAGDATPCAAAAFDDTRAATLRRHIDITPLRYAIDAFAALPPC